MGEEEILHNEDERKLIGELENLAQMSKNLQEEGNKNF